MKRRQNDGVDQLEPLPIKCRRLRPSGSGTSHTGPTRASAMCLSPTVEESPQTGRPIEKATQISRPTTSSAGRTPFRRSHASTLKRSGSVRPLAGSESNTEENGFKFNKQEDPFGANTHENLPIMRNTSPPDHVVSGSEMTFHSVSSSIPEIGAKREFLSRANNGPLRNNERKSLSKQSSKRPMTPVRSPLSAKELSNSRIEDYLEAQAQVVSPAEKWEALTRASSTSTESLAKSTKERRLRRSPTYSSPRRSQEVLAEGGRRPITPDWKRRLMNKRNTEKQKPARLSPEKKSMFETSPQPMPSRAIAFPQRPRITSPAKNSFSGASSRTLSQRSSSRPMNGAVKAMTAIFDNAAKDLPAGSAAVVARRTGHSSKEPSSIVSPYSRSSSPPKSIRTEASPAASTPSRVLEELGGGSQPVITPTRNDDNVPWASRRNLSPASPQTASENTPTRFHHAPLRPTGNTFSASRKVPLASSTKQIPQRDREIDQPPSLGTMVPYLEEPPIAQHISFIRPSQGATERDGSDYERASTGSPRPGSSNSMLHAQVRNLQRQLETRTEECMQLRRQLEARENMDIGKLCEQLRAAKRECKMWRERAESAEKRVAVFEQFTARVRGLRDAAIEEAGQIPAGDGQVDGSRRRAIGRRGMPGGFSEPSSYSDRTEDYAVVRDRIRQGLKKRATARSAGGGSHFEDDGGFWERDTGREQKPGRGIWMKEAPGDQTAQLWAVAEELLKLDG